MGGPSLAGTDANVARVVNIAVLSDGLVLLVRRADSDSLGGFWEIPGGSVESGEEFATAASRELREETGIRTATLQEVLHYTGPSPSGFRRPVLDLAVYRGEVSPRPAVVLDPLEHSAFRWTPPRELGEYRMMRLNRRIARFASAADRDNDGAITVTRLTSFRSL